MKSLVLSALVLAATLANSSAQNGTIEYYTGGTPGTFDGATNYSTTPGAAAGTSTGGSTPGPTTDVYFNSSAVNQAETIDVVAGDTALGIYVTNTSATTFSDGSGASLLIGTDGLNVASTAAIVNLANVTVGGTETWSFANTGTSTAGAITGTATTGTTETLTLAGPGALNQSGGGLISDGSGGGSLALTLTGGAYLQNTKNTTANTFSGGFNIVNGSARLSGTGQAGTGTITLGNSTASTAAATLTFVDGGTVTNNVSVLANGTSTLVIGGNGDFDTYTGTVNVSTGGTLILETSASSGSSPTQGQTFSNTISGGGGLVLSQPTSKLDTVTLSGANTFSGGTTLNSAILDINSAAALGTGAFINNGGTIDNTSGAAITESNANPITINSTLTYGGTNSLNLGTGAVTLGTAAGSSRTITTNGTGNLTIGGGIANGTTATAITKAGVSELTLAGANTYTGTTTLSAGTLNLTGSLVSAVSESAGTFEGTGSSTGFLTASGGVVTPGSATSIGTLAVGTTSITNAALTLVINSNTSQASNLNISGTLTINSGATLNVTDLGTATVAVGQIFDLANYTSETGNFTNATEDQDLTIGNNIYQVEYNTGQLDLVDVSSTVPEPGTWATMIGGLFLVLGFIKFRRLSTLDCD
jgi:fibronectin-binding autotransporter adhesin